MKTLLTFLLMACSFNLSAQPVANRRPTPNEIDQLVGITNNIQNSLNEIRGGGNQLFVYEGGDISLGQAKTNASAGDTVFVAAGTYDADNLLKNGVNIVFEPGAKVVRTTGTVPIFHDYGGATTNIIVGGEFIHQGNAEVLHQTNASSVKFLRAVNFWQNSGNTKAAIRQKAGILEVDVLNGRGDSYDFWWVEAATTRSLLRAGYIYAADTAIEWGTDFAEWGKAYAEVGIVEGGSALGALVRLAGKTYTKIGIVNLSGGGSVGGSAAPSSEGILEFGVIQAATNATIAAVAMGDLSIGPAHLKGGRIIGPTFGDVAPVNLSGFGSLTLENVELVAGPESTYALSAESGATFNVVGQLRRNKPIDTDATMVAGLLQETNVMAVPAQLYAATNTANYITATNKIALVTGTGASLTSGSGAPSAAEPNGSVYLRTTGQFYVRSNAAWVLVTGAF